MSPDQGYSYAFGGFVLNPAERLLLHFDRPVDLSGRDFDVLLHLVQHANALVSTEGLLKAVWGADSTIHHGNITNHIAKIRNVLGCDPQQPSFIRTAFGKGGYVFIAPVEKVAEETIVQDLSNKNGATGAVREHSGFQVSMNIFVPVFLGANTFKEFDGPTKLTSWVEYKEHRSDNARLCVLPSGIGVWHLSISGIFESLGDLAAKRKEIYDRIFQKRNLYLNIFSDELTDHASDDDNYPLHSVIGKPGYAYSLMIYEPKSRKHPERLRRVLEILASPQALEKKRESRQELERVRRLERDFLERGVNSLDMREFGMSGEDLGFASWEGASYCTLNELSPSIDTFAEFQIAVHSLWWQSKCLVDAFVADPDSASSHLKIFIPELKRQFSGLKNIDAKETTSQRTMAEAVLKVNRLEPVVEEALDLYS